MTDRAAFERLSAAEALRALYVDFEGEKDRPPVLLGVLRRERRRGERSWVELHVLDDAFTLLAGDAKTLHEAVRNVVMRAEKGDRRIVAWSEHELGRIQELPDPDLVRRFEARYANARRVAERWRNRVHRGARPPDGKLASYLALIGYAVPPEAAGGDVGQTIRDIRDRSIRGLPPTAGQAERWRRVIEHNRHDCIGMRHICIQAAREIEAIVDR